MPSARRVSDHITRLRSIAGACADVFVSAQGVFFEDSILGITQKLTDDALAEAGHGDVTADDVRALVAAYAAAQESLTALIAAAVKIRSSDRLPWLR